MIGVLVDAIDSNSQGLLEALNFLSSKTECCIFTNRVIKLPVKNKFAIFQQVEALKFKGVLIGTSIINVQTVINCLTCSEKYYYIQGPEWANLNAFSNRQINKIFYNDELQLITKNEKLFNLIKTLFKEPKFTADNWNEVGEELCQKISF